MPLSRADMGAEGVRVPCDKETVKGAPNVDADGHLSKDQEGELYRHYSLDDDARRHNGDQGDRRGADEGVRNETGVDPDASNVTDDATITRSEERLNVGTRTEETGRARLRKYVVTEDETVTVPVTKERVSLEREPISEDDHAGDGRGVQIAEEEAEIVLREERPVVEKEAAAVERVGLGKETVTEERRVSETVRKEQIDTDDVESTKDASHR